MYEIERETVILTTMKGDKTFSWDDESGSLEKSLEEVGLGRNTGFRVTIKKTDEEPSEASKEDTDQ